MVVLLALLCLNGGQAAASPAIGVAAPPPGGTDRLARGSPFDPGELLTNAGAALSAPQFGPLAGAFGDGGIEPHLMPPQALSSLYSFVPAARDALSSRVTAVDVFAEPDAAGLAVFRTDKIVISPVRPGDTGTAATTAPPTLQGPGFLTVQQALRDPAQDPGANLAIEDYAVTVPANRMPAETVRIPLKVSSSYGFLSSSLTVFTDEFASFGGIGQSFNGLTALNMAEPASLAALAVSLAGLAGLAALRRRRRH